MKKLINRFNKIKKGAKFEAAKGKQNGSIFWFSGYKKHSLKFNT